MTKWPMPIKTRAIAPKLLDLRIQYYVWGMRNGGLFSPPGFHRLAAVRMLFPNFVFPKSLNP